VQTVIGVDRDPQALAAAMTDCDFVAGRFSAVQSNYADLGSFHWKA
jgi:16S rRNA C1402 N4-methylase RsmH